MFEAQEDKYGPTHDFFTSGENEVTKISVPGEKFKLFKDFSPLVSPNDCFDALNIPPDHVSRKPTDTYYMNRVTCLRTHTSVH